MKQICIFGAGSIGHKFIQFSDYPFLDHDVKGADCLMLAQHTICSKPKYLVVIAI